jgi:hypothetical protein
MPTRAWTGQSPILPPRPRPHMLAPLPKVHHISCAQSCLNILTYRRLAECTLAIENDFDLSSTASLDTFTPGFQGALPAETGAGENLPDYNGPEMDLKSTWARLLSE